MTRWIRMGVRTSYGPVQVAEGPRRAPKRPLPFRRSKLHETNPMGSLLWAHVTKGRGQLATSSLGGSVVQVKWSYWGPPY